MVIDEWESTKFDGAASGRKKTTKYRIGKYQEAAEFAQNLPGFLKQWWTRSSEAEQAETFGQAWVCEPIGADPRQGDAWRARVFPFLRRGQ